MEDLIREVEGRFKVSITDSTMMWLLQQAMDKAHERVKSQQGVIARLNEISKFYELAIMQLDGCLKFVQEETGSYILESDHEEVLLDLREIRDRLQCRLKETELAILNKDTELVERLENELRLKQVLEVKENELVSLQANLERTRSEGVEEFIKSNLKGTNEDKDGEISELKNSVDRQVMNIRQKLEPEYKLLAGEEMPCGVDNKRIEKMGVDIDVLKRTLDLAFSKMQSVVFLSELGPIEQTWRWTIEKDAIAILIKGFIDGFKKDFEVEKKKLEKQVSVVWREHLSDFAEQTWLIRRELEDLAKENEVIEKFVGIFVKSSSDGENYEKWYNQLKEKVAGEDGVHSVAKMIKNHESIIGRKSEELVLPEPIQRQKSLVSPKRRIKEVISRFDNLIGSNTKLNEYFGGNGDEKWKETCEGKKISEFDDENDKKVILDSLDLVWEKMHKKSVSNEGTGIKILQQEKEVADLRAVILKENYMYLFKGLLGRLYDELLAHNLLGLVTKDLQMNLIEEVVNEVNEKIGRGKIKSGVRQDICSLALTEATENPSFSRDAASVGCSYCLENSLKENLNSAIFKEVLKELKKFMESYHEEDLIRQEVDRIVFKESLEDFINNSKHIRTELLEKKVNGKEMSLIKSLVFPCKALSELIEKSEFKICEPLGKMAFRLEKLETEIRLLSKPVTLLREKESLYRKAFILRCENLQKAETEVDLLGDQVDALLELLEKIHLTLHRHPMVLHQYSEISNISNSIKKELFGVFASRK